MKKSFFFKVLFIIDDYRVVINMEYLYCNIYEYKYV